MLLQLYGCSLAAICYSDCRRVGIYRDDILCYYDYYIMLGHIECNINTFLHMQLREATMKALCLLCAGWGDVRASLVQE